MTHDWCAEPPGAHALLLEALSEELLRHAPGHVWRKLFLGSEFGTIRFSTLPLTLLASDTPEEGLSYEEHHLMAARLGGAPERLANDVLAMSFSSPAVALRAALALQRLAPPRRIRTALSSARVVVASFRLEGRDRRLALGPALELAYGAVRVAPSGGILVSTATYAELQGRLEDHVQDAVVSTEEAEDGQLRAFITTAPKHTDAESTFAGLGAF